MRIDDDHLLDHDEDDDRDPVVVAREEARERRYMCEIDMQDALAEIAGGMQFVRMHRASTGSTYLRIVADDGAEAVVRIADHAECYPPSYGVNLQVTVGCREGMTVEAATARVREWYAAHASTETEDE